MAKIANGRRRRSIPVGKRSFGAGGVGLLNPFAAALLVIAVLCMWFLPRRYALVPFVLVAILFPLEQEIVVLGLHFMLLRIAILAAWLKLVSQAVPVRKLVPGRLVAIDKLILLWVTCGAVTYTILWADLGALVVKIGFLFNALGCYFLFRHYLQSPTEQRRLMRTFAIISAIIAVLMTVEQVTGHNLLSIFGSPAEAAIRNGRIRSQASFAHSITAGVCGAILLPLFVGLWQDRKSRVFGALGIASATIMTITSASSTPVAAYLAGIVGLAAWRFRKRMQLVRRGTVAVLVFLQIVMKAPVWALIGRIDFAGGSTGWHRFMLVDQFIHRFGEWWLIGTRDNGEWGLNMADTVNWYVSSGISGGLVGFMLFIGIIVYGFKGVGRSLAKLPRRTASEGFSTWCLGASLFAGMISFFGITLFDQSVVVWYALLAMIAGASAGYRARRHPSPDSSVALRLQHVAPQEEGEGGYVLREV